MEVYKVVSVCGQLPSKPIFKSWGAFQSPKRCILDYELNVTTVPKFGKIFAFKTHKNAKEYLDGTMRQKILKCKANHVTFRNLDWGVCIPNVRSSHILTIKNWWKKSLLKRSGTWNLPHGTVLCGSVTPLKIMK
jgi:hypothetical protein